MDKGSFLSQNLTIPPRQQPELNAQYVTYPKKSGRLDQQKAAQSMQL